MANEQNQTTNCGVSIEGHITQLMQGLQQNGLGARCEGTFLALVELTDYIKRRFGHTYEAKGLITDQNFEAILKKGHTDAEKAQQDILNNIVNATPARVH